MPKGREARAVSTRYTIGQLAKAAGVPTTTVRYYERQDLLRPGGRMGSNYRAYGGEELQRLRFIRAAQGAGFSLGDIATLLALRDGTTEPCREVQTLIERRLTDVTARLEDLRRVDGVLKASLRVCRRRERTGRCEVIDTLSVTAAGAPTRGRRRR